MKTYLLSVYQPEGTPPPPDVLEKIMAELGTLRDEMKAAGAWVFSGGLNSPGTATVLRFDGGDVLMTDGPFAEGKEYLGGFTDRQGSRPRRRAGMGPQARPGDHPADRGAAVRG